MTQDVLDVRDLRICFTTPTGDLEAVRDVSFSLAPGELVGLVGESGSGKSVTALAVMGLLPPGSTQVTGRILLDGRDLVSLDDAALRRVRGRRIGMVFQEPMTALDPVYRIGAQIAETLRAHERVSAAAARARAVELLDAVGIPEPARRARAYPHQLSGGMRQRVVIAIALAARPAVLIADEPTTALDATIQAQILELLGSLAREQGTAVLLISHDLGVVAETCTRMITMYAGEIVEQGHVDTMLEAPAHPYTSGLLLSIPRRGRPKSALPSIPGQVPALSDMPDGCRFHPRCPHREERCLEPQVLLSLGQGERRVRCCRHAELTLPGALLPPTDEVAFP